MGKKKEKKKQKTNKQKTEKPKNTREQGEGKKWNNPQFEKELKCNENFFDKIIKFKLCGKLQETNVRKTEK